MTSARNTSFSFRTAALPIYLPSLLIATGEGAIIPTLPVTATSLGASLALAGLISGLLMIAQVVGDLPAGVLVARFGENRSMIGGAGVIAVGVIICLMARNLLTLSIGVAIWGFAASLFALARHSLLTTYAPLQIRARALSLLGGAFRAGYFIGPFLAAAVIPGFGTQAVFWVNIAVCALTILVLLVLPDPAALFEKQTPTLRPGSAPARPVPSGETGLFATIVRHRGVLLRLGTGALTVGLLRSSRQVILPLWAVHLNLDATHTSLIIGIAGAVDFGLFYTSGQIMDRFGRAWSAVPSMIGLGLCHLALAGVHGVLWFAVVAVVMSMANGIGSGILMTLGADLAPRDDPAPFLGAWRVFSDTGNAAAPAAISALTALAGLPVAAVAMGIVGLLGAGIMLRYLPRYIPSPRKKALRSKA